MNWPQIDFWYAPLLGVSEAERAVAEDEARELTLSFVHWLQSEAPCSDGGVGYPELRLRGDVLGTADGLAREPYIREARRIRALFTITEGHIGREMRGEHTGPPSSPTPSGPVTTGSICTARRPAAPTWTSTASRSRSRWAH